MMELESNPDQPQTDNGETAADIRMLYEVNIADIRESKAQEWRITFLVFLLLGAIVAADRLLPDNLDSFIFASVVIAGLAAITVRWRFRSTIVERRKKLHNLQGQLSEAARGQVYPKNPWHDSWLPIVLTGFIVFGMFAVAWIVLLPARLPSP